MTVNEKHLKAKAFCSRFANLKGDPSNFSLSQKIYISVVKDLYLRVIKNELKDLDKDLFRIIKQKIYLYDPTISFDDSQVMITYLIDGVYSFLKFFPLKTFLPLVTDYSPCFVVDNTKIQINFDLIFKQDVKSNFIHGVYFVDKLTEHSKSGDYFNFLKLKFLSSFYKGKRRTHPPVKLHLLHLPSLTYRNKNLRSYVLKSFTYTERDNSDASLLSANEAVRSLLSKPPNLRVPACKIYSCSKRRQCFLEEE